MNTLSAIGNINNPELRFLPDSTPVLQFSFALNSGYGDKQITTWLNCSLFGKRAQTLADMVNKGDRVGITGELTNRKYTDKNGVEKYSLDVRLNDLTLLGARNNDGNSNTPNPPKDAPKAQESAPSAGFDDLEDSIPFMNPYKFNWRAI
jgi:single-strand DNA-binding protein